MKLALLIVISSLLFGQAACSRKESADPNANVSGAGTNSTEGDRSQARVLLAHGKELYRDDQDEKALEAFQQAVKLDPDLAEGYFRVGLTFDALGQKQEAEDAYKKAIEKYKKHLEKNSDDAEAHYNLGQTYAGLSLYSEAVREYRQATRLKSDDSDMFYDLGEALTKLAQYDEAANAFSKALEIDPNNYRAEDALEEAREGVKRIRAGRKHQEDLLKKKKEEELKKEEGDNSNSNADSSNSKPRA
ncbi:MAG: tetratricopeptide repeat protein, partial [Acidobacteriota bacterium]|nr:tetratricopeptide repeat protein [Acidobacteriota bacterium]